MIEGVAAGNAFQSGSPSSTPARVSVAVWPVNGGRPVNVSYSTQPKAQMSARVSTSRPRACSGLIYAAVPRMAPTRVSLVAFPEARQES